MQRINNRLGDYTRVFYTVLVLAVALAFGGVYSTVAADEQDNARLDQNRDQAVREREGNFDRAEAMWPPPTGLTNFPMRQALIDYTYRQDLVNHPWYIYVQGMNGEVTGYFIGRVYPQSICNFISSTERLVDVDDDDDTAADFIVQAPSYDGIFYGNCPDDVFYTFDQATNAMYVFKAPMFQTSDAPIALYANVPRIDLSGTPPDVAPPA